MKISSVFFVRNRVKILNRQNSKHGFSEYAFFFYLLVFDMYNLHLVNLKTFKKKKTTKNSILSFYFCLVDASFQKRAASKQIIINNGRQKYFKSLVGRS